MKNTFRVQKDSQKEEAKEGVVVVATAKVPGWIGDWINYDGGRDKPLIFFLSAAIFGERRRDRRPQSPVDSTCWFDVRRCHHTAGFPATLARALLYEESCGT
jgi:hypothetical protein